MTPNVVVRGQAIPFLTDIGYVTEVDGAEKGEEMKVHFVGKIQDRSISAVGILGHLLFAGVDVCRVTMGKLLATTDDEHLREKNADENKGENR